MLILLLACQSSTSLINKDDAVAVLRLSATSFSFSGSGGAPQTLTVQSAGDGPLIISDLWLSGGDGGFSFTSPDGALPGTLPGGSEADLILAWASPGRDAADTLEIASNDASVSG